MKVCVAGLRGIPDVPGGVETHCENLYGQLARTAPEFRIVVYGRKPYLDGGRRTLAPNLTVAPLASATNRYAEAISNTLIAVWTARFRDRADILHVHAIGPALVSPLARFLGLRVVVTHHGDDFDRAKWNRVARTALRLGERLGMVAAHGVIAVSGSLAARLRRDYPVQADKIHYVPNGADHIVPDAAPGTDVLTRHGLDAGDYIVSVGRLVPEKGFLDLIRAHERAGTGHKLVIVGGRSHSTHDAALRRAAGPGVVFTGTVPRADVAALLAHARLFVLASHHEGLPIAALEAAAIGAPVLLSDITPNRDLGLPAAHYFPVGDVAALADRLGLPDPAATLKADGLIRDFAWSGIADSTAELYRSLAPLPKESPA